MSAIRYIIVSVMSGILFGILDGVINANPLAQRLYAVYKPIAKASLNVSAGMLIDLAYGFIMAALFLLLCKGLPGRTALVKGMSFGLLAWFFRVVMCTASQWMMFNIPREALLYSLATGFVEMLLLSLLYGLTLKTAD
jgi:hypothetical protein